MNTKYISNKMRRVKKYKINHKLVKNEYMWRKISQKKLYIERKFMDARKLFNERRETKIE